MAKNNVEIEYELTYLASKIPDEIKGIEPKHMLDVYIPDTAFHPCLRLKKKAINTK